MLGSRYEIIAKLGSGGMSHVYQARCTILNRIVTVKTLRSELAEDKEFVRRFQVEAQAVASLSHPNIVSIYDVGEENGVPYLVMEYVEGLNLKETIKKDGPLSPVETVNLGVQVCAALAHAHERGIIHRDIKSQNILVTPGGRVKVTDFGLARVLSIPSATVTQSGNVMGSVHYLSPEQARGGGTGPRSDLYSLGVVLYEAVSGRLPFQADNPVTVALKHLRDAPAPLSRDNPAIPPRLEEIIFKALAKDPEQRCQSAREMQQALSEGSLLAGNGVDEDELTRELQLPARWRTRRRLRPAALVSMILLLLLLAAGGTYAFSRWFFRGGDIPVPKVTGLRQQAASEAIEASGLRPSVQLVYDEEVDVGIVVGQDPIDGYLVKKGRPVVLRVSKGPSMDWLPDLRGHKAADARIRLQNLGFTVKEEEWETDNPDTPPGVVASTVPPGEQNVRSKSEIVLRVSKQPAPSNLLVPSLVALTVEQARETLTALGLALGDVHDERSLDYPEGFILGQDVSQGTPVQPGTVVNVVLSQGPGPKQQYFPVRLRVNETGEVKVVVNDALGARVVYQQTHSQGYVLNKQFEVYGSGNLKIYFKGDPDPVENHPFN